MKPRPFLLGDHSVRTEETAAVHNPYDGALVAEVCVAGSIYYVYFRSFVFNRRILGINGNATLLL